MNRKVLPDRWGGLRIETEIILTEKPYSTALTVVFRVRDSELRRLKLLSATVTAGFHQLGLRGNPPEKQR